MPNTSAYLGFAQLYQRLRPKRSYAAGFTATLRTGSARVAVPERSRRAVQVPNKKKRDEPAAAG